MTARNLWTPGKAVELMPGLRRILAPNPSAMTYKGTNTYLLGKRDIAVIDPGPPDEAHLQAILSALEGHQRVSHILVTHSHIDHSPLAMVLAQFTGARVHAFGNSRAGRTPVMEGLSGLGGGEGIDETFMPDEQLQDGSLLEARGWTIEALHTPGHMGNHMCFAWQEGKALFSGDLVMGWATSMVSPPDGDLTQFMSSVERLEERGTETVFYPGHGEPVEDPATRMRELLGHRKMREAQIVQALRRGDATAGSLAAQIYTEVDPALLPAAERNVLAHLIDLAGQNRIQSSGPITADAQFGLI